MLTANQASNNAQVHARYVDRDNGPFYCSACGEEVILHKGRVRIPHFAHKPSSSCVYDQGESEAHRQCKQTLYSELSRFPDQLDCEMEKPLADVRPDILIFSKRKKLFYAIEVQISNLTMDQIIQRTSKYCKLGVYVLWLPIFTPALLSERYAPRSWEKWLHTLNYGKVYYWRQGAEISVVRFDEHSLWVKESSYGGGYYRPSKRWRTPVIAKESISLLYDFSPANRQAWSGGNIEIPKAKILLSKVA